MKLADFKVLTFDCYGTLIDWESGLYSALQPLLQVARFSAAREEVLAQFAQHEAAQQAATPAMLYPQLLAEVHRRLARQWLVSVPEAAHQIFGDSVPQWPAFPDSAEALQYLKRHYKLVILSNVDRASFAGSNRRLGVEFDAICTAQDIGSYKPDPRNFRYVVEAVARLGHGRGDILHTAQSLYHDHAPGAGRWTALGVDRPPARAARVGRDRAAGRYAGLRFPLQQSHRDGARPRSGSALRPTHLQTGEQAPGIEDTRRIEACLEAPVQLRHGRCQGVKATLRARCRASTGQCRRLPQRAARTVAGSSDAAYQRTVPPQSINGSPGSGSGWAVAGTETRQMSGCENSGWRQ